jgi:hypothetical protein
LKVKNPTTAANARRRQKSTGVCFAGANTRGTRGAQSLAQCRERGEGRSREHAYRIDHERGNERAGHSTCARCAVYSDTGKRVITVLARGVAPSGPDEISREKFEELGGDKQRVIDFIRERDRQGAATHAEV